MRRADRDHRDRRRARAGGSSFDGTREGRSSASRMEAAAAAASPCARRTSARPGWGSHPTRCAARSASSAPSMSLLRSRIRPSSLSGHPISRRRCGLSSSQAISASRSASSHAPRNLRISARCTRQRPRRLPMAFVWHHRSIASVHSSATSYCESLQGANELAVHEPGRKRIEIPETAATPTSSSSARPTSTGGS
jgi:hypothetical protein